VSAWWRRLRGRNFLPPGGGAIWAWDQHGYCVGAAFPGDRQRAPGKMGGHKPKAIAGHHRAWLLQRIKEKDFTLRGLVAELAERGLKVDYRSQSR
jgi:hypothetical protein